MNRKGDKPTKFTDESADVQQLKQFLEDIARFRAEEEKVNRTWMAIGNAIDRKQALVAGRKVILHPIMEEPLNSDDESGSEDEVDDDYEEDGYSTVNEDDESDGRAENDGKEDEDLEMYAQLLLEYQDFQEHEDEWIQEVEQKLMTEVHDLLVNLKACQMAAKQRDGQRVERDDGGRRRSSLAMVLETRRESAAQIRRQSEKAAKKVQRAKARELKARKALVSALKKQRQQQSKMDKCLEEKSKWDEFKKSVELEFEQNLASLKHKVQI